MLLLLRRTFLTIIVLRQVRPAGDLPWGWSVSHTKWCILFYQYKLGIALGMKRFMAWGSWLFQVLVPSTPVICLLLLYLSGPTWIPGTTNPSVNNMLFCQKYGKLSYQKNCLSALETWLFRKIPELYPNCKKQPPKFQQLLTRNIVMVNQKRYNYSIRKLSVPVLRNSIKHQPRK